MLQKIHTPFFSFMLFFFVFSPIFFGSNNAFAQTKFSFQLNASYTTSAGVYDTGGVLVRTLWKGKTYAAGSHQETWDNLDDEGKAVPKAKYTFKVLYHNVNYNWDGPIGNTSQDISGKNVFKGYYPIRAMAAVDTAVYYVVGYIEQSYINYYVSNSNIHRQTSFGRRDAYVALGLICTDKERIYMADNEGGYGAGSNTSFVYAVDLKTHADYSFKEGQNLIIGAGEQQFKGIIDLNRNGIPPKGYPFTHAFISNGASGLAVQTNGNILAVAHYTQNEIRLFDKLSGHLLNKITAKNVTALSMSSEGDLWAIVDGSLNRYTTISGTPKLVTHVTGFQNPLALAVDPSDPNTVLLADGGNSQQVKAFNKNGESIWNLGQAGGYIQNGNAVSTNKFAFHQKTLGETTYLTILSDHSFWVGDVGNNRSLHFTGSRQFKDLMMFQSSNYSCAVDQNDPTRVFSEFLEFKVDYSKPIQQSWTLVKNWGQGLDPNFTGTYTGLSQVTTLPNGKTFSLVYNTSARNWQLFELTGTSLRNTGIVPAASTNERVTILPDGSLIITPIHVNGAQVSWSKRQFTGLDGSGNPTWATPKVIASATAKQADPVPRFGGFGYIESPVTSSNILISFDQSKNNGFHLGGVRVGGGKWLWKTSPTGELNGKGNYDIGNGVQYAGNTALVSGRNIIFGYHGEFWKQSQAAQFMNYYDDGLFVGQFGVSSHGHSYLDGAIPGFAGNAFSPNLVKVNGKNYLWVNDESSNGPQRWTITGLDDIKELLGTGTTNSTVPLAAPKTAAIKPPVKVSNTPPPVSPPKVVTSSSTTQAPGPVTAPPNPVTTTPSTGESITKSIASQPDTGEQTASLPPVKTDSIAQVSKDSASLTTAVPISNLPGATSLISDQAMSMAYPNPVVGKRLNIVLPRTWSGTAEYLLSSTTGTIVTRGSVELTSNQFSLDFTRFMLATGIYCLIFTSKNAYVKFNLIIR